MGLPGERIHIADGKVHVNGEALELPEGLPDIYYTAPPMMQYGIDEDDKYSLVPEGHYLLLGDNSAQSRDGRVWGWVPNEHIVGRAACIWWPPSRWRDFTGFSKTWWWHALLGVLGLLLVVRLFFGRSWRAQEKAREGGKARNLHYYVNRWTFGPPIPFTGYRFMKGRFPKRGELVLYNANVDGQVDILFGRVAGLPGERVFLDDGKLQIDGAAVGTPPALAESFPADASVGPFGRSQGKQHSLVPEDHVFILADQALAHNMLDSRTVGWIPRADLIGAASAIWWPPAWWRRVQ